MGSGKVYSRAALNSTQIQKIEQEQFEPLPESFREIYAELTDKVWQYYNGEDSEDGVAERDILASESWRHPKLEPFHNYLDLKIPHLATIIDVQPAPDTRQNIDNKVLDAYLFRICQHANELRIARRDEKAKQAEKKRPQLRGRQSGRAGHPEEGLSSRKTRSRSPRHHDEQQNHYRLRDDPKDQHMKDADEPDQTEPDDEVDHLSCLPLGFEAYDRIAKSKKGSKARDLKTEKALSEFGFDKKQFLNLDYIFIPYGTQYFSHYALAGIAPRQKFLFVIDSAKLSYNIREQPLATILDITLSQIPDWYQEDLRQDWLVYGHWSYRGAKNVDNSPDCVQQADVHNCGVFTATNATCLAFGYDLMCYRGTEPDPKQDLIDRLDNGKRDRMACELYNGGFNPPFNYDLFEIPFVRNVPMDTIRPPTPETDVKVGEPELIITATIEQEGDDVDMGDQYGLNSPSTATTGPPPIVRDRSAIPWPPQFSPEHFERRTLLFKVSPSEKRYWGNLKTKSALRKACRERGFKGYSVWAKGEANVFRRWCKNYAMATRRWEEIAQGSRDVRPVEGLGLKLEEKMGTGRGRRNVRPRDREMERRKSARLKKA